MNIRDTWTHLVHLYGNCLGGIASAWEWRTNWGFTGGHILGGLQNSRKNRVVQKEWQRRGEESVE